MNNSISSSKSASTRHWLTSNRALLTLIVVLSVWTTVWTCKVTIQSFGVVGSGAYVDVDAVDVHADIHTDRKINIDGNTDIDTDIDIGNDTELHATDATRDNEGTSNQPNTPTLPHNASHVSACVLTKDDVPILPEWIAYHYHTLKVRHIVVAVDPTSTQSPTSVFDRFRTHLPDLMIEEWNDADFMPDAFLRLPTLGDAGGHGNNHNNNHDDDDGESNVVPNFVPKRFQNASTSPWHFGNESAAQLLHETKVVNRHRYRQRVFLHKCYKHVYDRNIDSVRSKNHAGNSDGSIWVIHVDTDEYVVVNPFVRRQPGLLSKIPDLPTTKITPDCIFRMLQQMFHHYPKRISRSCLSMPTILYGSVTNDDAPQSASALQQLASRMETTRWKYHGDWKDPINGFDKTLMDLSAIPTTDVVLKGPYAHNPHQPSTALCPKLHTAPEITATRKYPFTINHYLGTWQRFASRGDTRKSWTMYERKANLSSVHDDDGWIDTWLVSFVATHGMDVTQRLLGRG